MAAVDVALLLEVERVAQRRLQAPQPAAHLPQLQRVAVPPRLPRPVWILPL